MLAVGMLACSSQDHSAVPPPSGGAWGDLSTATAADLHEDDIAVARAAIRAFLPSDYGVPDNLARGRVPMVMPDRTMRACPVSKRRPDDYACIPSLDEEAVAGLLAADYGPGAVRLFRTRNAQSRPIRQSVNAQFQLVPSADLLDMLQGSSWSRTFAQRFPGRQGIVMVSAPIYPADDRAVVYVHYVVHSAAYVDLERQRDSWHARAVRGLWVS